MHRIILAAIAAAMTLLATAQTVEDCQAGSLSTRVDNHAITTLEVSGHIDARDFRFIADSLRHLTRLDLGATVIDAYRGDALFGNVNEYRADEVPSLSLASLLELTHLVLPQTATHLADGCLSGCTALTSVSLPRRLSHIGDYALTGCSQLAVVAVPQSLSHIGNGAFSNCASLQSVTMTTAPAGDTLTVAAASLSIGERAFAHCPLLKTVSLGDRLNSLGREALAATGLEQLSLGEQRQLTALPDWVLSQTPLTQLTLPANLQELGDGALMGADALSTLSLPATVDYIGSFAMAYTTGLTQLESKASEVPLLGDSVWYGIDQSKVLLKVSPQSLEDYRLAPQWCNFMTASLPRGDVNGDGKVDIADVNIIINIMLGRDNANRYDGRAYVTDDNVIDIADANTVINLMLAHKLAMQRAAERARLAGLRHAASLR